MFYVKIRSTLKGVLYPFAILLIRILTFCPPRFSGLSQIVIIDLILGTIMLAITWETTRSHSAFTFSCQTIAVLQWVLYCYDNNQNWGTLNLAVIQTDHVQDLWCLDDCSLVIFLFEKAHWACCPKHIQPVEVFQSVNGLLWYFCYNSRLKSREQSLYMESRSKTLTLQCFIYLNLHSDFWLDLLKMSLSKAHILKSLYK